MHFFEIIQKRKQLRLEISVESKTFSIFFSLGQHGLFATILTHVATTDTRPSSL